ncbi:uncharacterized protein HKW66_Vig0227880 [Vigna angularis]|uniref:Uncharacterized protein n=1 Tax=Phaseolus angularis TaxID=3914 RepID=A0A8T0KDD2_PHAAN|nr:uncharacterized protein HKW66_Vig0227880 [Vigna angularis]
MDAPAGKPKIVHNLEAIIASSHQHNDCRKKGFGFGVLIETLIPIKENQRTKETLKSKHPSDLASEPDSNPDYRPHRLGSKTARNRFVLPTCSLKPLAPPPQPLQAPSCEAAKRDIDFWKSWPFGFDNGRRRWLGKRPTGARESTTGGGTTAGASAVLLGSRTGSGNTGKSSRSDSTGSDNTGSGSTGSGSTGSGNTRSDSTDDEGLFKE